MRNTIAALGLVCLLQWTLPITGFGQGQGTTSSHAVEGGKHEGERHGESPWAPLWRWGNFLLLFGGLGWYFRKPLHDFLSARARGIEEGLVGAESARRAAVLKSAEVDTRLAQLDQAIQALRFQATAEAEEERQRIIDSAQLEAQKILDLARREIGGLQKSARLELKGYVAELAVKLAEERLKAQVGPEEHKMMVEKFLLSLDSGKN
jgi:F-type H+-transporting ATPase subunit b